MLQYIDVIFCLQREDSRRDAGLSWISCSLLVKVMVTEFPLSLICLYGHLNLNSLKLMIGQLFAELPQAN